METDLGSIRVVSRLASIKIDGLRVIIDSCWPVVSCESFVSQILKLYALFLCPHDDVLAPIGRSCEQVVEIGSREISVLQVPNVKPL